MCASLLAMSLVLAPATEPTKDKFAAQWTAITELKKYGARFTGVNFDPDLGNRKDLNVEPIVLQVTIDSEWTGGKDKLKCLRGLPTLNALHLGGEFNDDWCSELANLPQLEIVRFTCNDNITDQGLAHLAKLRNLREVDLLGCTKISDKGLRFLADKKQLQILSLAGTHITDEGLVHLKELENLEYLNLEMTNISGNGLKHLRGLTKLYFLRLTGTTPNKGGRAYGLEHLAAMRGMTVLEANFLGVTDEDLVALRNMPGLVHLKLAGNRITDKGLESLCHLAKLDSLDLSSYDSGITNNGLKQLQNLNISWLSLNGSAIDDNALEFLRKMKMKNLRYVNVDDTKMTKQGMKSIE